MLEDIEKLTEPELYEASKEGLTKIQNLSLKRGSEDIIKGKSGKKQETLNIVARKNIEQVMSQERLKRDLVSEEDAWRTVKNKRHKPKQETEIKMSSPSTKLLSSKAIAGDKRRHHY